MLFMRKKISTLLVSIGICSMIFAQQKISINANWSFSKNGAAWEHINLPHSWNDRDVTDDLQGYHRDICSYRKQLIVDETLKDQVLYLLFEGVNHIAEVFVNGRSAGIHTGGYTAFYVPLDGVLHYGNDHPNEIEVKVDNRHHEDVPPLSADFTFYGGIYRDVYLVAKNPVHFSFSDYSSDGVYLSTPKVSKEKAIVQIRSLITNDGERTERLRLVTTLYNAAGKMVTRQEKPFRAAKGETTTIELALDAIANPNLWSPENPYLYKAVTQIINRKGEILDEQMNAVGFRWFRFDPQTGFYLNDKQYKLIGASRHQDYKDKANALTDDYVVRDVELLKQMGGNFLRIAHYPQDRSVLEACDRLGILASIEIPLVNAITETQAFTDNSMQMLREMLRQYHNYPSLVIWCYMNEILLRDKYADDKAKQQQYHRNVYELAKVLEQTIRREDPSRYTMNVSHGAYEKYRSAGLVDLPMISGWNIYNGWYSGNLEGFSAFLDKFHHDYPDKVLAITEFGADSDPRVRSDKPVRFDKSTEYATLFHQYYYKSIMERPFVAGGMIWNLADFNSETRAETMPHINNKGILTWDRKTKDQYLFYQTQLADKPKVKILNALWEKRTGMADKGKTTCTQPLLVTSNQPSVELTVNGKSLGMKDVVDGLASWDVPFADGINRMVARTPDATDIASIEFILHPNTFEENGNRLKTLNLLLGTNRYFMDPETNVIWMPDQPYRKGSFGHTGGKPYQLRNSQRTPFGTDKAIALTDNDPVYQTQQVGIEAYRFDVPVGKYELTLNFAELEGGEKESLVYNLGNQNEGAEEISGERVFDVFVNEMLVLHHFNIAEEFGITNAVSIKIPVIVTDQQGITIHFRPVKSEPVLNSLQLKATF